MEELAGSLLPFLLLSFHSHPPLSTPHLPRILLLLVLEGPVPLLITRAGEGCRLKINQNLICALLGYART